MRIRSCLMILVTTLVFAKGGITTVPITSTFADLDATGLPYDVQSDGHGSYSNGVAGVTTFLTSNGYNHIAYGDWQFDTYSSTTRVWNPVLAMKGDKNCLHVFPRTSGPPDTRTEEPGTGSSRWNTPPHACDLFTLKQVFGSLWFATCPCARGATGRSVSARRSLELNNK